METTNEITHIVTILDHAFGALRIVENKKENRIVGIDIPSTTSTILDEFKAHKIEVIVLVPTELSKDDLNNLKQYLHSVDEIIPLTKDVSKALFELQESCSLEPEKTLLISVDRFLRGLASKHGFLTAPHLAIASLLLRGCSLNFVKAIGDRDLFERLPDIVPYFTEYTESGKWHILSVMSQKAIAEAISRKITLEILPLNIALEDPIFVHLDKVTQKTSEELLERKVLFSDGRRILFALGPSDFNDSISIYGAHGYLHFLMPMPELVEPPNDLSDIPSRNLLSFNKWPHKKVEFTQTLIRPIDREFFEFLRPICYNINQSFSGYVDRYSGSTNLDNAGSIISRHIQHTDNSRVVQALLSDLRAMGFCAYTHSFNHSGMILKNVIADMPGTGFFRIDPNIRELLREIFIRHPFIEPLKEWMNQVIKLVGEDWVSQMNLERFSPHQLRLWLEKIFQLESWYPWWRKNYSLPGLGAKLVIVGCHLDSTISGDSGFNPLTDPAPGADDNASGIAATLALAKYLSSYRGKLSHTVRFCFFNAEESGILGSKAYASKLKAAGAPVKAAICMDMIGYNSDQARIFEVHAGYTDPQIRDASEPIANSVAAWAASLGALSPAQIYRGTNSGYGSDRNVYDAAINRSDHAAFHQQGYPAVVVSEDFFVNLPSETGADPNPNYHTINDTAVDDVYGADIACAVAQAVKELAW